MDRGTTFMNAHAQMSLCGPSRASFLTSRRPDTLGVWSLRDGILGSKVTAAARAGKRLLTIPSFLRAKGYTTIGVGKIFHENEDKLMSDPQQWTEPVYTWKTDFVRPPSMTSPYAGAWIESGGTLDSFFPDHQAAILTAQKITQLADKPEPFAVFLGFWKPHLPWQAPAKYYDMQNETKAFPAGYNVEPPTGMPTAVFQMVRGSGCGETAEYMGGPAVLSSARTPADMQRQAVRAYHATVSFVDAQIGIVLDALDASVARSRTHVILLGDHGFHLGDHGLYCKHTNFEQGTRAPLIIAPAQAEVWPRGVRSWAPVELLDVLPTVGDLLGVSASTMPVDALPWEGVSLVPLLVNARSFVKWGAVSQYFRGTGAARKWGYSVRTTRYRFTAWCSDDDRFKPVFGKCALELWDYVTDDLESASLAVAAPQLRGVFTQGPDLNWKGPTRFDALQGRQPFDFSDLVHVEELARHVREYP